VAKSILLSDEEIRFVTEACGQCVRQMNAYSIMSNTPMPAEVQATVSIATALSNKLGVEIESSVTPMSNVEVPVSEPSVTDQMAASIDLQRKLSRDASTRIERIVTALLPIIAVRPDPMLNVLEFVKYINDLIATLEKENV
jgi:hypothetical protein